jgi:hypothetical protein
MFVQSVMNRIIHAQNNGVDCGLRFHNLELECKQSVHNSVCHNHIQQNIIRNNMKQTKMRVLNLKQFDDYSWWTSTSTDRFTDQSTSAARIDQSCLSRFD